MIKIAVCDDDQYFVSEMEEMLLAYADRYGYEFEVETFTDGSTLMDSIRNQDYYDLIYMDIRMDEGMDGISAARLLRQTNRNTLLIYVSAYDSYMKELFEVEPFRFMEKPVNPDIFCKYLAQAIKRIKSYSVFYHYTYRQSEYRMLLSDILYFESRQRKILIHTKKGTETFYQKLNTIEKELKEGAIPFIRIHQSYLVNYFAITRYNMSEIELFTGEVLPISGERQKNVRSQYHVLIGRED